MSRRGPGAMRIAVLCHIRHPIRPPFMGGMEAHAWHLARGLTARGHDVTLLASGDSDPSFRMAPIIGEHYDGAMPWHEFHGTSALNGVLDAAFSRAVDIIGDGDFDVVHNNSLHRFPPRHAKAHRQPMVTSLHVPPFEALSRAVHDSGAPWHRTTVTSRQQLSKWWPGGASPFAHVVPNGIDLSLWPFSPEGDGSAVWAGRITPTKGTHLAAEAARRSGVPLRIFGTIEHGGYFADRVRPLLGGGVEYGGHLPPADLAREMGKASALLFTPLWDEPFGLAAIEGMATGLPVAAIDRGAVREVVGPVGRYASEDDPAGLSVALDAALGGSRTAARDRVERLFTLDRMIDRFEDLYREAANGVFEGALDTLESCG